MRQTRLWMVWFILATICLTISQPAAAQSDVAYKEALRRIEVTKTIRYVFQFASVLQAQSQITEIRSFAWSPDGSQIAMGGITEPADISSQTPILTIRNAADPTRPVILDLSATTGGQTQTIMSVSWSPNGKYLASGSADGTIAVWAINDQPAHTAGQLITKFGNYNTPVTNVAWSPDGKWIANIAEEEQINIWSAADYHLVDSVKITASADLTWSPDSSWLATTSDLGADIYSISSTGTFVLAAGYRLSLDPSYRPASGVSWNASGSQIAVANRKANKIFVFDSGTQKTIRIAPVTSPPGTLAWSPDGTKFAFGSGNDSVRVVNASTGTELAKYATGLTYAVETVHWKPDNSEIGFSSVGNTAQIVVAPGLPTNTPIPTDTGT